ncbi:MAG: phosphoribosylglycinamide formyltransferase [Balneolaceae bacterium]
MNTIVVFASGSGSNFQAIIDAIENETLDAQIAGLISSKKQIQAIQRAKKSGIPVRVINPSDYRNPEEFGIALLRQLHLWNPFLIVLAGYTVKVPDQVISEYRNQIINIHPSLLPKFGGRGYFGKKVHKAVLEAGEKISGCSVHFVDENYDEGPIIAQRQVPVLEEDTPDSLAERILDEEHKLLPEVIARLLSESDN